MKKVMQTNFSPTDGNCFQACIASLFELEIDNVPHFMSKEYGTGNEWWSLYNSWLTEEFNSRSHYIEIADEHRDYWINWLNESDGYFIAAMKCSDLVHAVIIKGSELFHNPWPYPQQDFTFGDIMGFDIIYLKNPNEINS